MVSAVRRGTAESIQFGWNVAPVRWMALAGAFMFAVVGYLFYAMQPYLLELYGDPNAYLVASVAATAVAGAQIVGGIASPHLRRRFTSRTSMIMAATMVGAALIVVTGLVNSFWFALAAFIGWSITFSVMYPVRQAFLNAQIDSQRRATVLSVDSLVSSTGTIPLSPALGRAADAFGYSASFFVAAGVQLIALPFLAKAKLTCPPQTDRVGHEPQLA